MTQPAAPACNEADRLSRLHALAVLDTEPEEIFDSLARAAAVVCGVPCALFSLVDEKRQWFKANVGLPGVAQTDRDISFCSHAILGDDVMEVADTFEDERFARNPLVTGSPKIRFYAGAPVSLSDGMPVGTLCVIGLKPNTLSEQQRRALKHLAAAAGQALETRHRAITAMSATAAAHARIERLYNSTPAMLHSIDASGRLISVSDAWLQTLGYKRDDVLGLLSTDFLTAESRDSAVEHVIPWFFRTGSVAGIPYQMRHKDGRILDVLMSAVLEYDADGQPSRSMAVTEDITTRRLTERRLIDSEARYRALIDQQTELISLAQTDGTLTFVNPAYARLYDATPEAMIGRNLIDFVEPLQHKAVVDHLRAVCQSRQVTRGENHIVTASGERRWVSWSNTPIIDEQGAVTAIHSVGRDITERKKAENALRRSQALLRRTGAVAGVGGWEIDLLSQVVSWSEETCRLHEVALDYQPTLNEAIAFIAPSGRPVIEKAVRAGIEQGTPWDLELPVISAKGRQFWARAVGVAEFEDGKVVRLVGAFQDISARRQIESDLAESRERLQVTLESIGDAVITTDKTGKVTWLNPVAEQLTGWLKADALNQPLADVYITVDDDSRLPLPDPVAGCLDPRLKLADHPLLVSRSGATFDIENTIAPIKDSAGSMLGAVLVFRDVSDQRRQAREMRHRASHDALTGLPNRMEFESRLNRLLARARSQTDAEKHALLYVDLDHFKAINDRCGHAAGDRVLREASALLQSMVHPGDTVARLGGDEFAILLHRCDDVQGYRVASRICEQMSTFNFHGGGQRLNVGASIGLIPIDARWDSLEEACRCADAACYSAKANGRGQVHIGFRAKREEIT